MGKRTKRPASGRAPFGRCLKNQNAMIGASKDTPSDGVLRPSTMRPSLPALHFLAQLTLQLSHTRTSAVLYQGRCVRTCQGLFFFSNQARVALACPHECSFLSHQETE